MMVSAKSLPPRKDAATERALQRLAGAVLLHASSGPRRYREEALEWFGGKTDSGMTFEFCCSLLGRVPDDVRNRLMKKNFLPKSETSFADMFYGDVQRTSGYRPSPSALYSQAM
jgi:hypothetical protein